MSPYQQDVIDTTLAEFDRQQAIADTALRDKLFKCFWWGRQGVMAEAARGAQLTEQITSNTSTRISTSTTSSGSDLAASKDWSISIS